jgi:hypothetical protein
MGKKIEVDAVQMVRQIRDEHAKRLNKKSHQEIIEFFKEEAEKTKLKSQRIRKRIGQTVH